MKKIRRNFILILCLISLSLPANQFVQPAPTAEAQTSMGVKTMDQYVSERGFYQPTGEYIADNIANNKAAFEMVRDYAAKYAPMAGADPAIVTWWTMIETKAPYSAYTYNNCHNNTDRAPDFIDCDDDWQVAYGQQYNVAANQLVKAYTAVYGDPNDKTKVQQVIQNSLTKAGVSKTAPNTYTVGQLQSMARDYGNDEILWTLMLSRDPGISIYLLSTALISFDRDEAFGYGQFYRDSWQVYSNGLNDVLEAWGTPGTPTDSTPGTSGNQNGTTWGPTEPPLEIEVPDCPGVTRTIDASHLPPSIYPKPTCGAGSSNGNIPVGDIGLGQPSGKYGTSEGAPAVGALFWVITGGKQFPISQGFGMTPYVQNNPQFTQPGGQYEYCNAYKVPGHCGVDVDTPQGTLVYTPAAGRVICAGTGVTVDSNIEGCTAFDSSAGIAGERGRLQVELANGDMMIFGHMSKITVTPGQQLKAGDPVGLTGNAGTGPHFHLEYRHKDGDGWIAYDPRDMFDVPANGSSTPTPVPTVQGVSTTNQSNVLAETTMATTMEQFQTKYGFNTPDGQSDRDFAKYSAEFAAERDLAVKYAPEFGLEPQMVAWWTWAETKAPFDSYHYQNCDSDSSRPLDQSCPVVGSGDWQVGYGQQYAVGLGPHLAEVFQKTHGDPNNPTSVQQVGQNVLSKSGVSKTFPAKTVSELMANEAANRDWIFALQRDQAISVYLTAEEIKGDIGSGSRLYRDIVWGWSPDSGYYQDEWQNYSNLLNDIITNWGIAPGSSTGLGCSNSTTNPNSSCSTLEDNLQGMSAEEFMSRINANLAGYKSIAACANVPWQMMAAIHMREAGLRTDMGTGLGGAQGPWQIDPTGSAWGSVDPFNFEEAGCAVAKIELQSKSESGPVGRPLTQAMNPDNHDDEVSIKDAFFAYNGRGGYESNIPLGCTENFDGHDDWNFDCSAYVMNNWDANHTGMCINGDVCQDQDGTWKVFYKLYHSTYGADGKLEVYGGQCNTANGVINGVSLPTAGGLNINSHFFENGHVGIDIANTEGQAVLAVADGDVSSSGWDETGGYYVIQHVAANVAGNTNERWVYYGHLAPTGFPAKGSQVKAGQQIATTGPHMVTRGGQQVTNGVQSAPHLHFDIRTTNTAGSDPQIHVNPCSIELFKTGYPNLDCDTWGSKGVAW